MTNLNLEGMALIYTIIMLGLQTSRNRLMYLLNQSHIQTIMLNTNSVSELKALTTSDYQFQFNDGIAMFYNVIVIVVHSIVMYNVSINQPNQIAMIGMLVNTAAVILYFYIRGRQHRKFNQQMIQYVNQKLPGFIEEQTKLDNHKQT